MTVRSRSRSGGLSAIRSRRSSRDIGVELIEDALQSVDPAAQTRPHGVGRRASL